MLLIKHVGIFTVGLLHNPCTIVLGVIAGARTGPAEVVSSRGWGTVLCVEIGFYAEGVIVKSKS